MKKILTIVCLTLLMLPVFGQKPLVEAYRKVLTGRSDKIVKILGITDSAQYKRIVDMIVNQFLVVGKLHDTADSTVKTLRNAGLDKEELTDHIKAFQNERDARLYIQHVLFAAQLQGELTPEQVEDVKNGLTNNVLNDIYKAQLEMIPTLKDDEKRQIRIWLLEARERAIDAASSDSKNGWFGQCKGRINNYLTAKGYNLDKERAAWVERIKQQKNN
jgi:hypothetical protein